MITITINGKVCTAEEGKTILEIASANGIEIPTLCHHSSVKKYGACGVCLVEAEKSPKLMRACSTVAMDGQIFNTESDRVVKARKTALELLMSDHDGDCKGPCTLNCPAGTDCQGYVKKIAEGDAFGAVELIKEKLPLPASIGRVCPHPCEKACRRSNVEEPISIAYLKYYAADKVHKEGKSVIGEKSAESGKTVGIIGGGPGGLTAAYYLALKGHKVSVFDSMPKMGGMLRYGIPEYRLPKSILDKEINEIASVGVELVNNYKIGKDISFDDFCEKYDAVIVAIGAWKSMGIGCIGEDLEGVWGGIDFLRNVSLGNKVEIGDNVAIVGGGNTAMDACRTAVRLGAKNVYVIYRRTEKEMPAEKIEISEAKEEGVIFKFLTNPAEIIGENGKVKQVKLQVMELGEPDASGRRSPVPVEGKFEILDVDTVISAIGQKVNVEGFEGLELNKKGIISADEFTFRTSKKNVFAIGDATNKGASIAIAAISEANKAADVVDSFLNGDVVPYSAPYVSERNVTKEMFADIEQIPRVVMPCRPAEERKNDFAEVNLGLTDEQAIKEAKRCLECGCHEYKNCRLIRCANRYKLNPTKYQGEKHMHETERKLVSIERNQGKCILCGLCVRVCDEVVQKGILGLVGRGFKTVIKPEFNNQNVLTFCKDCHKCVDLCPTGALKLLK